MIDNSVEAYESRLAAFAALRAEGKSIREAARIMNIGERSAFAYSRALKSAEVQAKLRAQTPPIRPIVPEGFEVRRITSKVDADGNIEGQHIGVKPEAQPGETVPEGHVIKGLSTLLDESGGIRSQWVKTRIDDSKLALLGQKVLAELNTSIVPYPPVSGPAVTLDQLATLYTFTDTHIGMLAWPVETHAPAWDLQIAEKVLSETFLRMIDMASPTKLGIFNQLGDALHFDSLLAVTPTSGNVLDSDSRYQLVVLATVRILKRIVSRMLEKHQLVHVFMHEGNHDMAGSVWLRVMFAELFRENPRVTVCLNPNPYQALQHGKTMLGFHHGHLAKKEKLPAIFAAQYAKMWGATEHRYVHTGHYHEVNEREYPGIIVTQHPTIASPDAYAARAGYLSKRQATAITYHNELGEVARATYLPHQG